MLRLSLPRHGHCQQPRVEWWMVEPFTPVARWPARLGSTLTAGPAARSGWPCAAVRCCRDRQPASQKSKLLTLLLTPGGLFAEDLSYRNALCANDCKPSKQPVDGSNPSGGVSVGVWLFSQKALLQQAFGLTGFARFCSPEPGWEKDRLAYLLSFQRSRNGMVCSAAASCGPAIKGGAEAAGRYRMSQGTGQASRHGLSWGRASQAAAITP